MKIKMDNTPSNKSANSCGSYGKSRFSFYSLLLVASMGLAACGGGADSQKNPGAVNDEEQLSAIPGNARNSDVVAFQDNVWQKLRPNSVCGDCHRPGANNPTRPYFADWNDVNAAYDTVVSGGYVNLATPASSELVNRVKNGHNCWLASNDDCAAAMTTYITNWANGYSKGSESREVQLTAPTVLRDLGDSILFPTAAPPSYSAVHDLLTQYCSGCHVSTAGSRAQTPYFAVAIAQDSYNAAKIKIDLNTPASSEFVTRLGANHNCWSNCTSDAATMQAAIQAMATDIQQNYNTVFNTTEIITSKALYLTRDGIQASGGNRYEASQIALYEFKSRSGDIVEDSSGVFPLLNLTLYGAENVDYRWLSNWGIEFLTSQGRAQGDTASSKKLHDLIKLSGQYSLEAWVIPGNVTQDMANIISYSAGSDIRNFTLGQTMYNYDFFHRSSNTDTNGAPPLSTPDADEVLQATLQHVVVTYDSQSGRKIYVNGELVPDTVDTTQPGDLLSWHSSYALIFGNEADSNRPWQGTIRMVAIHDRALTPAQILLNYSAEVGQKYLMPFSVSHITGMPDESYIVFEVSQFDEFSYLFSSPRYVNLAGNVPTDIPLSGMRLGLNSTEVPVGQTYTNISPANLATGFTAVSGTPLSDINTIIELQNGADLDLFFLTFEALGDRTRTLAYDENDADPITDIPALPTKTDGTKSPDIGIKTFEEINASMAKMTNINDWATNADATAIKNTYLLYKQQLPSVESIEGFLSSHQMAIAQLAMAYCNLRVDRDLLELVPANRFFANFDFSAIASTAFNTQVKVDLIVDPLLKAMLNVGDVSTDVSAVNLLTQPDVSAVRLELNKLINDGDDFAGQSYPAPVEPRIALTAAACMAPGPGSCDTTDRTKQIVKAACTAVMGSAAMSIQ